VGAAPPRSSGRSALAAAAPGGIGALAADMRGPREVVPVLFLSPKDADGADRGQRSKPL